MGLALAAASCRDLSRSAVLCLLKIIGSVPQTPTLYPTQLENADFTGPQFLRYYTIRL